jgi:5'-nucleotidase
MQIVYVDMDDVLCDFMGTYKKARQKTPEIKYPQSQIDFFRKLPPIEGAIEGFNQLWESKKYEVYILTAPSVMNPLCYMEKRLWVTDHFSIDVAQKLILSPNKALLKGDFLIDDMINGKGQEDFEGELITFGSEKYPNWKSVIKKLAP